MGKVMTVLSAAAVFAAVLVGTAAAQQIGTFTDGRDGQKYKTVKIGKQTWMAQNINYQTKSGSWCYDNAKSKCVKYGRLYDWETAMAVCPSGWYLPSQDEYDSLLSEAGGDAVAGKILKARDGWSWNKLYGANKSGNGTDMYGFSALPGGLRIGNEFRHIGEEGDWWLADANPDPNVFKMGWGIGHHSDIVYQSYSNRDLGKSVRCVAAPVCLAVAAKPLIGTFTDTRDGQTYKTVKMPDCKTWMAQNLNYETERGSWCYENNADSCKKYGRLYEWKTAKTVCPNGWKLPNTVDWDRLVQSVGSKRQFNEGGVPIWDNAGKKLKSNSGWNDNEGKSGNGTDNYGLSALPGGFRNTNGDFGYAGYGGLWWTATVYYIRGMGHNYDHVDEGKGNGKDIGLSVRCVADTP
jgi:uncharacterized protein (TIGR02145 family)